MILVIRLKQNFDFIKIYFSDFKQILLRTQKLFGWHFPKNAGFGVVKIDTIT